MSSQAWDPSLLSLARYHSNVSRRTATTQPPSSLYYRQVGKEVLSPLIMFCSPAAWVVVLAAAVMMVVGVVASVMLAVVGAGVLIAVMAAIVLREVVVAVMVVVNPICTATTTIITS